jgi:hypothetical protein
MINYKITNLVFFFEVKNQPQETLEWHNQVGDY